MTIISDTTCLSTLARIGQLDLLHALFGEVIMPQMVYEELLASTFASKHPTRHEAKAAKDIHYLFEQG